MEALNKKIETTNNSESFFKQAKNIFFPVFTFILFVLSIFYTSFHLYVFGKMEKIFDILRK